MHTCTRTHTQVGSCVERLLRDLEEDAWRSEAARLQHAHATAEAALRSRLEGAEAGLAQSGAAAQEAQAEHEARQEATLFELRERQAELEAGLTSLRAQQLEQQQEQLRLEQGVWGAVEGVQEAMADVGGAVEAVEEAVQGAVQEAVKGVGAMGAALRTEMRASEEGTQLALAAEREDRLASATEVIAAVTELRVASVATELVRFDAAEAAEAAAEERAAARQELRQELGQELKAELRASLAESAVGAGAEAEARWLEMGAAVQATGRRVEALETALGSHAARQAEAAAAAATTRAQDMRQLGEAQSVALKMLADEMRWLDEEHMRCRAEDRAAHTHAAAELRSEVDGRLGLVQSHAEAQLQSAAQHVEQLDGAVAQLCARMETARAGEVAPLAKERISEREVHLVPTQARDDEAVGETQAAAEVEEEEEELPAMVEEQLYAYMRPPRHEAKAAAQTATAASTVAPEGFQEAGMEGGEEGGEAAGREADGEADEMNEKAEAEAEAKKARLAKCVWPPAGMNDPEEQAAWWVGAVTGRGQPEGTSLQAWLKSGVVLCELINTVSPGSAATPSTSEMPFRQMGNIAAYADAARLYGVPEPDMFVTVDLFEGKNLSAVVQHLHSLGRVAQQRGFSGPACLGVRLASKNVRQFSQAQLDEARTIPALRLPCDLICGRMQPLCIRGCHPIRLGGSTPVCT